MTTTQTAEHQVNQLLSFKQRDKFSLTPHLNACADVLIAAIEQQYPGKRLKAILQNSLSSFKRSDYDTAEREFICDLYYELATIVGVNFNDNLNTWLYGSILVTLMKIRRWLKPERVVETLRQPCTQCNTVLETLILQKEKGLPDIDWTIVKCSHCGELNLMSHGPDIKEARYINYQLVEPLRKSDYTREQALVRLEQIKIFRK